MLLCASKRLRQLRRNWGHVTGVRSCIPTRLRRSSISSGTETRTYDSLDRLLSVARGTSTFSYQYDVASNVTKRTYPDGIVVDYTYDPLGRMASVVNGTRTVTYAYDPASNPVTTTLPSQNGYVETRTYDRAGRLTQVKSVRQGATLADVTYTRDPVGNPLQETTTGSAPVTKSFGYDQMDRLTSVCFQAGTCPGGSDPFIRWTYDGVGNRLSEQRPSGTTSYTYDARDRLLSAGATSYTYDANGNELAAGSRTFTWDLANRLKTTTLAPTTTTYTYDGDGIRTQASTGTTNQSKTNFTWDVNRSLPQVVREASGSNSIYRRYFYGTDLLWMSTLENNSNAFYFHYDPLGSVRNVTAQGGATQLTYDYEPYGTTRTQTGSSPPNLVKFTGEYEDPTGLYHLRARQYDPASGRLLRPDPAQPALSTPHGSIYSYVMNRPTVLVDPAGLEGVPASPSTQGQNRALLAASPHYPSSPTFRIVTAREFVEHPHFSTSAFRQGRYEYAVKAWWLLTRGPAGTTATLTLELQLKQDGFWFTIGITRRSVPPGPRNKVTAAAACVPNTVSTLRGRLDTDIDRVWDTPFKKKGDEKDVPCSP